jgi:transglutaminase-like putative cysteine protease
MKLQVFHRTRHLYAGPVRDSFNETRLQPPDIEGQRRHSFILKVLPATRLTHYLDFYLNCVHIFELSEAHQELTVEATSVVTTTDLLALAEDVPLAPLSSMSACLRMERCYDFLQPSHYVISAPEVRDLAESCHGAGDAWILALELMHLVHRDFIYQTAATHVHSTMEEVLRLRRGVCQDFAHVLLALCRARQIPARYVSGYIYNGPAGLLQGAQASHAWVEVFLPERGWHGLDPTNDAQVDGRYVKVAVGRDYADVSPMKGTYRGPADRQLYVDVVVTRLDQEGGANAPNGTEATDLAVST